MDPMTTTASLPTVNVSSQPMAGTDVPADIAQMLKLAETLASADLYLPQEFRGKPGNLLAVMMRARALDIPLAVAWDELYVTGEEEDVAQTAKLARALARRAGHRITYVETTRTHAVALIQCAGEPQPHKVVFTLADAQAMGLTDPETNGDGARHWEQQPENMLVARVTMRGINRYCPEVLLGMGVRHANDAPVIDSDTLTTVRLDHEATVRRLLRLVRLAHRQANNAVLVQVLRGLFMVARQQGVLDFAADPEGTFSVRTVVTEAMIEADRLAKKQASGDAEPAPADSGPATLDELYQYEQEMNEAEEAAYAEADRRMQAQRAQAEEEAYAEAAQRAAQPAAPPSPPRPRSRAARPRKTPTPSARAGGRVGGRGSDDVLDCGCPRVQALITGTHTADCTRPPQDAR